MKIFVSLISFMFSVLLSFAAQDRTAQFVREAEEYKQKNDYVNAFQCYVKGLVSAIENGDDRMMMKCCGNMSIIYHDFGDFDNSIYFAHKGYDIARKLGASEQMTFLSNFVSFYSQAADTANASKYYEMMCEMLPQSNDIVNGYFFIYERARLEKARKQLDKAIESHMEAHRYAVTNNMPPIYVLFQDSEIGNILIDKKEWSKALEMGRKCLAKAEELSNEDLIINSYKMIAGAYGGLGIKDSSDYYMQKYYKLQNEVYDVSRFFHAHNEVQQYKDNKAQGQINRLIIMLSSGLTVIMVFIILIVALIRKNTSLRNAQRLLIDKYNQLNEAESKDIILREKYLAVIEERDRALGNIKKEEEEEELDCDDAVDEQDSDAVREIQEKLLCKITSVFEDISVISDPDFSLSAMAEKVGSNTKYVSMVINRTYNKNFKTLLNEHRIKEACKRMTNADYDRYTIKAIASEVGFRNTVSFIRCFKNIMGMTPSIYQKLSKE